MAAFCAPVYLLVDTPSSRYYVSLSITHFTQKKTPCPRQQRQNHG